MSARSQVPGEERSGLTLAEPVLLTLKKSERVVDVIRKRWWVLAITLLLGASLGVTAGIVSPAWYESTASFAVLPVDDPTAPQQFDSSGTAPPLFTHVLTSRRVADQVVTQLNLTSVYQKSRPDDARAELLRHVNVAIDRKANVVTLAVEDRVPSRARQIAQSMGDYGRGVSAEIWSAKATEHRKRLEVRLQEVSKALTAAEDAMRAFREREKVVDLPEQMKASVAEATILARIKNEKRLGLDFAKHFGGSEAPEVRRSEIEAGGATAALQGLVHGGQRGPFLALDSLPRLEVEHARLKRDIDTNASLYDGLSKQVEQVRAVEARPGGRVEQVDTPTEPRQRVRPSRFGMLVYGCFFGFLLGLAIIAWPRVRYFLGQLRLPAVRG